MPPKAPELFCESSTGFESDIWSAGIVLCLLLSGSSPFEGSSILSTLSPRRPAARSSSSSSSSEGLRRSPSGGAPFGGPQQQSEPQGQQADSVNRKRRPPQFQEASSSSVPPAAAAAAAAAAAGGDGEAAGGPPGGPPGAEAVRARLQEALGGPQWASVAAAAKDLIQEMLNVDARLRPSAAKILQSAWLQSD
ncbi:hypothetical protein, conserved [Eimeria tenella]|uniref:Protein kinase domain-containing protein n=1 Tax=Eimeria tenella TaxID=5802 RepID=U6KQP9_EIMTE|nr:hypothetical protein, conserved [Eimeria tenella]CDJ37768.1 hypothetical protein, conserved [Eimeria tenella]|eukprot:XP_013228606.1 hypothetical protein, conserved [Eimeria tenella]